MPFLLDLTIEQGAVIINDIGGMSEWFKEAVLKTVVPRGTVGSNPTPSAIMISRVCKTYQ